MKKAAFGVLAIVLGFPLWASAQSAYLDPSQPINKRVDDLMSQLTPTEKTSLLSTTAPAIDRLKVPVMNGWNQSLHGIVWSQPTTMFPVSISMAATWDPQLVHDVAGAIADEGRAVYNYWHTVQGSTETMRGQLVTITPDGKRIAHNGLVYRSPVINMDRDPRWGRIWETFGEDPLLASRITVAYVQGTQGSDPKYLELAATLKHYAAYDDERDRVKTANDMVPERTLMDYYLPQFKAGIMAGKASSIMSSYNGINGMPNAENKIMLTDILRDEWGFQGFVVPDSGAVRNLVNEYRKYPTLQAAAAKTVLAGSDLDDGSYAIALPKALDEGLLAEKDVDQSLRRVLKIRFRLGEFDPPDMVSYNKLSPDVIDSPAHRELALRTARESIVLLANENHLLPLDKSKIKTLAVIGPFADYAQTGPNYTGEYSKFVKPLEGIQEKAGPGVKVLYARGSGIVETDNPEASLAEAVNAAKQADVAILFVGTNQLLEREGLDREFLNLPPVQIALVQRVMQANPNTVIVLLNGGPISLAPPFAGGGQRTTEVRYPTVLDMFWAGEEGGTAIADVLFGDYNPSGRLPYTVYASDRGLPPMTEYDISKGFTYMYVIDKPLFAFGHGLSYTSFDYSNLSISAPQTGSDGTVTIHVNVKNTGDRAGEEVVQLYVHNNDKSSVQPREQLQGFERVSLNPSETKTVNFELPVEQLSSWDTNKHAYVISPGVYDVMVGSASDDIRQKGNFDVTNAGEWPPTELTTRFADGDYSHAQR
ncbi:glycoside hydrolase family 3 protein [Candidatus Sulfotelmatomonas gaucii]|uniref:Glycoside hydrolase family 3 protein n=1 Tax=Candidatus Sulfuritelmatomonas gaucii TaxID=2043161 RepID=A0A2N9LMD7_9BACT|nr:glycoside hydrolase family 3 protein [Candidatus Sulfotelmatomonas gaucii]